MNYYSELLKAFPSENRCKSRMHAIVTFSTLYCSQHYTNAIRQVNKINDVNIGKEDIKLSLFVEDMTAYLDNLKTL